MDHAPSAELLSEIVDRVSIGVLVVNKNYEIVLWNTYMENYSQRKADDVIGKNIFESFPDLPRAWLEQKIRNVFILKNFSFTSWEHRPYLFKFLHNRPITGGIDYMRQNCTFLPIKGDSGDMEYVCITLFDVTDTSIYESMLKNAVRSLAEASNKDGLTSIYNRRFLETSMSKEFSRIKRYGGTLSFVIIDLDHFKNINDTYGHLAGDEILKIASKRIGEYLRESDILARYGGEEFAVMLPETPLAGAKVLANRLCANVAKEPVRINDFEINISASLGVAEFQPDLENHEQLISRADTVLYMSKENGRNQVTVFDHNDPEMLAGHTDVAPKNIAPDAEEEPLDSGELAAQATHVDAQTATSDLETTSEEQLASTTTELLDTPENIGVMVDTTTSELSESSVNANSVESPSETEEETTTEIESETPASVTTGVTHAEHSVSVEEATPATAESASSTESDQLMSEEAASNDDTESQSEELSPEEKADMAMIEAYDHIMDEAAEAEGNVESERPVETASTSNDETDQEKSQGNPDSNIVNMTNKDEKPIQENTPVQEKQTVVIRIGSK